MKQQTTTSSKQVSPSKPNEDDCLAMKESILHLTENPNTRKNQMSPRQMRHKGGRSKSTTRSYPTVLEASATWSHSTNSSTTLSDSLSNDPLVPSGTGGVRRMASWQYNSNSTIGTTSTLGSRGEGLLNKGGRNTNRSMDIMELIENDDEDEENRESSNMSDNKGESNLESSGESLISGSPFAPPRYGNSPSRCSSSLMSDPSDNDPELLLKDAIVQSFEHQSAVQLPPYLSRAGASLHASNSHLMYATDEDEATSNAPQRASSVIKHRPPVGSRMPGAFSMRGGRVMQRNQFASVRSVNGRQTISTLDEEGETSAHGGENPGNRDGNEEMTTREPRQSSLESVTSDILDSPTAMVFQSQTHEQELERQRRSFRQQGWFSGRRPRAANNDNGSSFDRSGIARESQSSRFEDESPTRSSNRTGSQRCGWGLLFCERRKDDNRVDAVSPETPQEEKRRIRLRIFMCCLFFALVVGAVVVFIVLRVKKQDNPQQEQPTIASSPTPSPSSPLREPMPPPSHNALNLDSLQTICRDGESHFDISLVTPNIRQGHAAFVQTLDAKQESINSCSPQNLAILFGSLLGYEVSYEAAVRYLLAIIYFSTSGPSWNNRTNWARTSDYCEWKGLFCVGNVVIKIDLSHNGLEGSIPTQLQYLTDVEELQLQGNELRGGIPNEFEMLENLVLLNISGNDLTGILPHMRWPVLQMLDLHDNMMIGTIPRRWGEMRDLNLLDVSANNLQGRIPTEIAKLSRLQKLNVAANALSGRLEIEVDKMLMLEEIRLGENGFRGTVPPGFGSLASNLRVLDVSGNKLTGQIPQSLPSSIQELYFQNNSFSGTIPLKWQGLTSLTVLNCSFNNISSTIPSELGKLSNMTFFNMQRNELFGTISPLLFPTLGSLEDLNLAENSLFGTIPSQIGFCTSLKTLVLQQNAFTGSLPSELSNASLLESLNIYGNNFSGTVASDICQLSRLSSIVTVCTEEEDNLLQCDCCGNDQCQSEKDKAKSPEDGLLSVQNLLALCNASSETVDAIVVNETIREAYNAFQTWLQLEYDIDSCDPRNRALLFMSLFGYQESPESISRYALSTMFFATNGTDQWMNKGTWLSGPDYCAWKGVDCVRDIVLTLNVAANGLVGSIPSELYLLSALEEIRLDGNDLEGTIPSEFGNLSQLIYMNVSGNNLSGTLPLEFSKNMTKIRELDLQSNKFVGSIPSEWARLTTLIGLYIGSNALSGTFPTELGMLTNLQVLSLRENNIHGELPQSLSSLSKLSTLDCHENRFDGNLPDGLWQLLDLETLKVGNNTFDGIIPSEMGVLKNLELLDINGNRMTGSIPSEIGLCSSLQFVYMQDNILNGTLPSEIGKLQALQEMTTFGNQILGTVPSEICDLSQLSSFVTVCGEIDQVSCGCCNTNLC